MVLVVAHGSIHVTMCLARQSLTGERTCCSLLGSAGHELAQYSARRRVREVRRSREVRRIRVSQAIHWQTYVCRNRRVEQHFGINSFFIHTTMGIYAIERSVYVHNYSKTNRWVSYKTTNNKSQNPPFLVPPAPTLILTILPDPINSQLQLQYPVKH